MDASLLVVFTHGGAGVTSTPSDESEEAGEAAEREMDAPMAYVTIPSTKASERSCRARIAAWCFECISDEATDDDDDASSDSVERLLLFVRLLLLLVVQSSGSGPASSRSRGAAAEEEEDAIALGPGENEIEQVDLPSPNNNNLEKLGVQDSGLCLFSIVFDFEFPVPTD